MSDIIDTEDTSGGAVPISKYVEKVIKDINTPQEVELNGPGFFIQKGKILAEVPLDELRTPKGIAFWLRHLLSKSWFSLHVARQWADALCKFLH